MPVRGIICVCRLDGCYSATVLSHSRQSIDQYGCHNVNTTNGLICDGCIKQLYPPNLYAAAVNILAYIGKLLLLLYTIHIVACVA